MKDFVIMSREYPAQEKLTVMDPDATCSPTVIACLDPYGAEYSYTLDTDEAIALAENLLRRVRKNAQRT